MQTMFHRTLAAIGATAALALGATPAWADTTDYSFSGYTATFVGGVYQSIDYVATFSVVNPATTPVLPVDLADYTLPVYASAWAGSTRYYTGAQDLLITFANGATLRTAVLDTVVNNTTFSGTGAPYPEGLSVQLYGHNLVASGMTASKVCADGSIDDACDASGESPLYRRGDDADLFVQGMTNMYFSLTGAPLSTVAAGVPNLANTFPTSRAIGGMWQQDAVTGLRSNQAAFAVNGMNAVVTPSSPIPEPGTWALWLAGLGLGWLLRGGTGRQGRLQG